MYSPGPWVPPPPPRDSAGAGPVVALVLGIGAILFLFFGAIGAVLFLRTRSAASARGPVAITTPLDSGAEWSDFGSPVPVSSDDPMRGDRSALVTLVLFEDFQDPFCARLEPTLDTIRTTYAASEVRFIWKNEPLTFHPLARSAAEAAQGVFVLGGNTAFWTFHDRAFAGGTYALGAANYDTWAGEAGVNAADLHTGLASGLYSSKIDVDVRLAGAIGASATPTTFINGRLVSGAQPLVKFTSIIDSELSKARRRIASGTSLDRIYVVLSKENFAAAPPPTWGGLTPPPAVGGLVITDTVIGTGAMAVIGDKLVVQYTGTLDDGSVFDSSRTRGTPFEFEIGRGSVIKGWETGLVGMKVGGKRTLTIPPEQAYGTRGVPPKIPPNATLHFDVELIAIK